MKRFKELLIPAISAIAFIFLTAYIAEHGFVTGFLFDFCFMFHTYPFGVGFSGGDTHWIMPYYISLWLALTLLFLGLSRLITLIFKRSS